VVVTSLFEQLYNVIAYVFSLTCASIFFAMLDQNQEQMWHITHSYDILGARMLWKPKEARILTNFIDHPCNLVNIRGSRMF
jgi:hypothetical protein